MKKMILVVLTIFAVTVPASAIELGVGSGVFIPMEEDAKDVYDAGYSANIYADFQIVSPVTLRVLGLYYSADGELNGVSQRLQAVGGGAMLMLKPELGAVQPYLGLGYSAFSTKSGSHSSHYQSNSHNNSQEWGHGFMGQAGVDIPFGQLLIGANATYIMNDVNEIKLGGLTAGLNIGYNF